jgi:hypothetical protein
MKWTSAFRRLLQRQSRSGAARRPNQISPNLKATTVDEFVVGADQELLSGLTASLHYTYRSIRGSSSTRTSA